VRFTVNPTAPRTRFSSYIRLYLLAGNQRIELAQVAPGFVILRIPTSLPRGRAEISIIVDDDESRFPVLLSNGSVPFDTVVEYERLSA
jgi:hypothetical protein